LHVIPDAASRGSYTARLRVTDPDNNRAFDQVTVNVDNGPPVPVITAPPPGTTWKVGDVINLSGSATDPEDGALLRMLALRYQQKLELLHEMLLRVEAA